MPEDRPKALMIAAPSSGAGKTVTTLALLRALRRRGVAARGAKSGPDYIDPAFHAAAAGAPSVNLDAWAMDGETLRLRLAGQGGGLVIVEAAMGVLDGARDGTGSAADLAGTLGIPVALLLDISRRSASAALAVAGLRSLRPNLKIAGVILNRSSGDSHARSAARLIDAPVFGSIPADGRLRLPERHLGLVQAAETENLERFLDAAAEVVESNLDIGALVEAAGIPEPPAGLTVSAIPPIGQRIAVARDTAFAFAYPHVLDDWSARGAEISVFSPLMDEAPPASADSVFLPGGYPELHAGRLAASAGFMAGLRDAAERGAAVYGECGGYMTLGAGLIDADGARHRMAGLLPVETSFASRRLHLGYRRLRALGGALRGRFAGHEFHYASVLSEGPGPPLFAAADAEGTSLPDMGLRAGTVAGSFAHLIAPLP